MEEQVKRYLEASKLCGGSLSTMGPDGAKSIFTGPRNLDKFVDMYVPDRLNDGAGASHAQTA